jgi:hypothetical protein
LFKAQKNNNPIRNDELMTFSLTPVPNSIAEIQTVTTNRHNDRTISVEGGNARLYTIEYIPETFQQISLQILDQLPRNVDMTFSSDKYYIGI